MLQEKQIVPFRQPTFCSVGAEAGAAWWRGVTQI